MSDRGIPLTLKSGAQRALRLRPTLTQIIDGVLYEISVGGMPEGKVELVNLLHRRG